MGFQFLALLFDEGAGLNEHSARPTGGIKDGATVGLDDLDHEPDHGTGGVKLAPARPFSQGKLAEEIFVDVPEHIPRSVVGDVVKLAQ